MSTRPNEPCLCHSGKKFKKCCRPILQGMAPPNPEALMRARFTAYATGNINFIMETTHPESPKYNPDETRWRANIRAYTLQNLFIGLEILAAEADCVRYQATLFSMLSRAETGYIEDAQFKQHEGRWMYFDGEVSDVPQDDAD